MSHNVPLINFTKASRSGRVAHRRKISRHELLVWRLVHCPRRTKHTLSSHTHILFVSRVCMHYTGTAIRALPESMTADYYTALYHCPLVVGTETHPSKFLRCEQGNSWAAALRLVQNWTLRRHVFGTDYWLKPTQLQGGALHPTDIHLLRTGAFGLFTPTTTTTTAEPRYLPPRQVLVADFGRLQGLEQGTARQRILFYIMVTGLNEYTQQHGLDVIVIINGRGMKIMPDNGRMIQNSHTKLAFKIRRFILVQDPTDRHKTLPHLFRTFFLTLVQKFWGNNIEIVNQETQLQTRRALEELQIHASTIPAHLGGDIDYESYIDQWLSQRLQIEGAKLAMPKNIQPKQQHDLLPTNIGYVPQSENSSNVWERPQKNRLLPKVVENVAGRAESSVATTACDSVPDDSSSWSPRGKKPRKSRQSKDMTQGDKVDAEKMKEAREKSAYYSRLSYHRKKQEHHGLEVQREDLQKANNALREEGERLTSLIAQAEALVRSSNQHDGFFSSFFW